MIEKLLNERESKDYILGQINPPPGINFSNEIMEKRRQKELAELQQVQLEKEMRDKMEQEKKMVEMEKMKNSIFKRTSTSKIDVVECIRRQSKVNIVNNIARQGNDSIRQRTTKFILNSEDDSKLKKEAENYLEEKISGFRPRVRENKSILK